VVRLELPGQHLRALSEGSVPRCTTGKLGMTAQVRAAEVAELPSSRLAGANGSQVVQAEQVRGV